MNNKYFELGRDRRSVSCTWVGTWTGSLQCYKSIALCARKPRDEINSVAELCARQNVDVYDNKHNS